MPELQRPTGTGADAAQERHETGPDIAQVLRRIGWSCVAAWTTLTVGNFVLLALTANWINLVFLVFGVFFLVDAWRGVHGDDLPPWLRLSVSCLFLGVFFGWLLSFWLAG